MFIESVKKNFNNITNRNTSFMATMALVLLLTTAVPIGILTIALITSLLKPKKTTSNNLNKDNLENDTYLKKTPYISTSNSPYTSNGQNIPQHTNQNDINNQNNQVVSMQNNEKLINLQDNNQKQYKTNNQI